MTVTAAVGGCASQRVIRVSAQEGWVFVASREVAHLASPADALWLLVDGGAPIAVRRAGGKLRAWRAICTHRGCTLDVVPEGFECPCHGSRFDQRGRPTGGPAVEPLIALRADRDERGMRVEVTP